MHWETLRAARLGRKGGNPRLEQHETQSEGSGGPRKQTFHAARPHTRPRPQKQRQRHASRPSSAALPRGMQGCRPVSAQQTGLAPRLGNSSSGSLSHTHHRPRLLGAGAAGPGVGICLSFSRRKCKREETLFILLSSPPRQRALLSALLLTWHQKSLPGSCRQPSLLPQAIKHFSVPGPSEQCPQGMRSGPGVAWGLAGPGHVPGWLRAAQ